MSTSAERKYPKSIRKILILGQAGAEPKHVDLGMTADEFRTRKVSKAYRPMEAELRASAEAAKHYYTKYLELHDAANEDSKNGSLEHLPKHVRSAQKAAWKTMTKESPITKQQKKLFKRLRSLTSF